MDPFSIVTAVDSCVSVAAQFQITEAEFYAMVTYMHNATVSIDDH